MQAEGSAQRQHFACQPHAGWGVHASWGTLLPITKPTEAAKAAVEDLEGGQYHLSSTDEQQEGEEDNVPGHDALWLQAGAPGATII